MKKYIIIIVVIFILSVGIAYGAKAKKIASTAKLIDFDVESIKFDIKFTDIAKILGTWTVPATVYISANNFSKNSLEIEQLKADILTTDKKNIARQISPITESISIAAKTKTIIEKKYMIDLSGIVQMIAKRKNLNPDSNLLLEILNEYFTTGAIGEKVLIKGFVLPKGLIKVELNEEVEF